LLLAASTNSVIGDQVFYALSRHSSSNDDEQMGLTSWCADRVIDRPDVNRSRFIVHLLWLAYVLKSLSNFAAILILRPVPEQQTGIFWYGCQM
jgi:hypothetical protein